MFSFGVYSRLMDSWRMLILSLFGEKSNRKKTGLNTFLFKCVAIYFAFYPLISFSVVVYVSVNNEKNTHKKCIKRVARADEVSVAIAFKHT